MGILCTICSLCASKTVLGKTAAQFKKKKVKQVLSYIGPLPNTLRKHDQKPGSNSIGISIDDLKLTTVFWSAVPVLLAYGEPALPLEVENQTRSFLLGLRIKSLQCLLSSGRERAVSRNPLSPCSEFTEQEGPSGTSYLLSPGLFCNHSNGLVFQVLSPWFPPTDFQDMVRWSSDSRKLLSGPKPRRPKLSGKKAVKS